ncbi:MAG: HAL/PAL/TAL family ammonia-lyase [bacterium JZ-2024 1]
MHPLILDGHSLTLDEFYQSALDIHAEKKVEVAPSAIQRMKYYRQKLKELLARGEIIYGVNTGIGALKSRRIPEEKTAEFQRILIDSHASGWGNPMPEEVSRGCLLLLANSLARGYSAVRPELLDRILFFVNSAFHPPLPRYGSVGASGDLIPMAHLARALISPYRGLPPFDLQEKEGLSLINNLCFTNTLLCLSLKLLENLLLMSEAVGALTTEVLMGSVKPFQPSTVAPRNQPIFLETASFLSRLTRDSEIVKSHEHCERVQDAYSLRCQPQISGSFRFVLSVARSALQNEINSSSDNPIFSEEGILSYGGNFHGELQGFVAEWMKLLLAEGAALSAYRTIRLLTPELNEGLPPFLSPSPGIHSGWMLAQSLQADLLATLQSQISPAMVHKIPVSGFQEDFVSFSATSAAQVYEMIPLAETILAVELLCAVEGAEKRAPLKTGRGTSFLVHTFRQAVPSLQKESDLSALVEKARQWIHSADFLKEWAEIDSSSQ